MHIHIYKHIHIKHLEELVVERFGVVCARPAGALSQRGESLAYGTAVA